MSPHLSQLNAVMAHIGIIYFRRNNRHILKFAKYTTIEDHYSGCKLATFRSQKKANLFCLHKHPVFLICNENKEICAANLIIKIEVLSS